MKKILFAMILACAALSVQAQEFPVKFKGAQPNIRDFITALTAPVYGEDGEMDESMNYLRHAWRQFCNNKPQDEGVTFSLDEKNGYACYEYREVEEGVEMIIKAEMCYWNEADKKHKLFAFCRMCYEGGRYSPGQYDGLTFYRYDNAKKTMRIVSDPGVDAALNATAPSVMCSFELPRTGKDITMTRWLENGQKRTVTLKWNGRGFSK